MGFNMDVFFNYPLKSLFMKGGRHFLDTPKPTPQLNERELHLIKPSLSENIFDLLNSFHSFSTHRESYWEIA